MSRPTYIGCVLCLAAVVLAATPPLVAGRSCQAKPDNNMKASASLDPGKFNNPRGIAADAMAKGYVYVADRDNNKVQIFDKQGKKIADVTKTPQGGLQKPYGVAVDCASDGLVYVSENNFNRIIALKKDGTYLGSIGAAKLGHQNGKTDLGDFKQPTGVAVDSGDSCDSKTGKLYTMEYGNHRIQIFEKRFPWKFIKSVGVYGNGKTTIDCSFAHAAGLAVDNSKGGLLYVADTHNFRVSAYTKDGDFVTAFSERAQFGHPFGIAVDSAACGHVYVADTAHHQVEVFTKDLKLVRTIGDAQKAKGDAEHLFNFVGGVAVDSSGPVVYVTDAGNKRVQVYKPSGGSVGSGGNVPPPPTPASKQCKAFTQPPGGGGKTTTKPTTAAATGTPYTTAQKTTTQTTTATSTPTSTPTPPTTLPDVKCKAGEYRSGSNPGMCKACSNERCKTAEYRTGSCVGTSNGFKCSLQPKCPSPSKYLAGASSTKRGQCLDCANAKCAAGQYRTGDCQKETNGFKCGVQPTCSAGQYLSGATGTARGTCKPQAACRKGEFLSEASGVAPGVCKACSQTTFQGVDQHRLPSCRPFAVCEEGQFEAATPTSTSDRVCATQGACSSDQYESKAPTATTNRQCVSLSQCRAGERITDPPKKNDNGGFIGDLACGPCNDGGYQDQEAHRSQVCKTLPTCPTQQYLQGSSKTSSGSCTTCANVQCPVDEFQGGACSGTTNGFVCTPCHNVTCADTEYRDGVCGGALDGYQCRTTTTTTTTTATDTTTTTTVATTTAGGTNETGSNSGSESSESESGSDDDGFKDDDRWAQEEAVANADPEELASTVIHLEIAGPLKDLDPVSLIDAVKQAIGAKVKGITDDEMQVTLEQRGSCQDGCVVVYWAESVSEKQLSKVTKLFAPGDGPELQIKSADGEDLVRVTTSGEAKASKAAPVPTPAESKSGADSNSATVGVVVAVVVAVVLLAVGAIVYVRHSQQGSKTQPSAFENPFYGDAGPTGQAAAQFYGGDPGAAQTSGYMDVNQHHGSQPAADVAYAETDAAGQQSSSGYMDVQASQAPAAEQDDYGWGGSDDEDV